MISASPEKVQKARSGEMNPVCWAVSAPANPATAPAAVNAASL